MLRCSLSAQISTRFDPHGMLLVSPGATLCAWLRQRALVALQLCRKRMLGSANFVHQVRFRLQTSDFRVIDMHAYFCDQLVAGSRRVPATIAMVSCSLYSHSPVWYCIAPVVWLLPKHCIVSPVLGRPWNELARCVPVGHRCGRRGFTALTAGCETLKIAAEGFDVDVQWCTMYMFFLELHGNWIPGIPFAHHWRGMLRDMDSVPVCMPWSWQNRLSIPSAVWQEQGKDEAGFDSTDSNGRIRERGGRLKLCRLVDTLQPLFRSNSMAWRLCYSYTWYWYTISIYLYIYIYLSYIIYHISYIMYHNIIII